MVEDLQKIFVLSEVEYSVLLAGKGADSCYTLQSEVESIDSEKVCMAMAHLYNTGLIDSDGDEFIIDENLNELVEAIINSSKVLFVRFGKEGARVLCGYITNEFVVICEKNKIEKGSILIYKSSIDELREILQEELPKDNDGEIKVINVKTGEEINGFDVCFAQLRGELR